MDIPAPTQNTTNHSSHFHISKEWLYIIASFFIGVFLSSIVLMSQLSPKDTQKQTVTITGTGTIDIPADQAVVYGRINTVASTEKQALAEVIKTTEIIKKGLLALGVSEAEMNIGTPYVSPPAGDVKPMLPDVPVIYNKEAVSTGERVLGISMPSTAYQNSYVGANNIDITLSKNKFALAEKVAKFINDTENAASDGKPFYQIKTVSPYLSQAREKALLDAKEQVDNIAKINKLQVKKVISIKENSMQDMKNPQWQTTLYVDPLSKKAPLSFSYEVKYELAPSLLPF